MKQVNCRSCGRLLAKIGSFNNLEIKCPRCKAFNVLSVKNALSEAQETPITGNIDDQSISKSTPTVRGAKTHVFERISQNTGENPK
ncbi:Com family DNA-binding transcriptional regulator [Moraxella macacae]|nr:Com family DNA-binding transcriptional regulator [Moraxella macacae]